MMKTSPAKTEEALTKRVKLLDGMIKRAEVRRARALELGNQREADGAKKTIEEARENAKICHEALAQLS